MSVSLESSLIVQILFFADESRYGFRLAFDSQRIGRAGEGDDGGRSTSHVWSNVGESTFDSRHLQIKGSRFVSFRQRLHRKSTMTQRWTMCSCPRERTRKRRKRRPRRIPEPSKVWRNIICSTLNFIVAFFSEHKRYEDTLESCQYCIDSRKLQKHLIVATGLKV